MPIVSRRPERRASLASLAVELGACALVFPLAALLLGLGGEAPSEDLRAVLHRLPLAVVTIGFIVATLDATEPRLWRLWPTLGAAARRATLVFIGLFWLLVLTARIASLPLALFGLAWLLLVLAYAGVRAARLVTVVRLRD